MWWMMAVGSAWADGLCPCVEFEVAWVWSPCDPAVEACGCACTDVVPLTGTIQSPPAIPVVVCSAAGLAEPDRADAQCLLASAKCVPEDCGGYTTVLSNPDTGDKGDEGGSCSSTAVAPPGGAAVGLLTAAVARRRRRTG